MFTCLATLLDTSSWTKNSLTNTEKVVAYVFAQFKPMFGKKQLESRKPFTQINCFEKLHSSHYSKHWVWTLLRLTGKIFTNSVVKQDCKNILLVFEISLIIPFANAKVEARKFVGQQQHHKSTWKPENVKTTLKRC